jgi:hypothetical protein
MHVVICCDSTYHSPVKVLSVLPMGTIMHVVLVAIKQLRMLHLIAS